MAEHRVRKNNIIYIIPTDEEMMIANETIRLVKQ